VCSIKAPASMCVKVQELSSSHSLKHSDTYSSREMETERERERERGVEREKVKGGMTSRGLLL
jgi:hypothetical protein